MTAKKMTDALKKTSDHPFRSAVFRGLAIVLPPLLTIVIFLWIGGTVKQYVLEPVTTWTRTGLVWAIADIRQEKDLPDAERGKANVTVEGQAFHRLPDKTYVPQTVYETVAAKIGEDPVPKTGDGVYTRFVEVEFLKPWLVIPFFLGVFIILLSLLGRFMAAGIGRVFWNLFEGGINRVPLVRNVYSSVKQVSDFMLSEREIEYSRVVAVEWPRKGIWALGLVTGESLKDIHAAANEPVLSVLVCTSPMPMTGFTVTVLKSETIDLDITIDQAFQFVISCGVVVPPHQLREMQAPDAERRQLVGAGDSAHPSEGD